MIRLSYPVNDPLQVAAVKALRHRDVAPG